MKKIIMLVLCLTFVITALTGCSSKYQFTEAFFPIEIIEGNEVQQNTQSSPIDVKHENLVKELLPSLTTFINNTFNLNIDKPAPVVKAFSPTKDSLFASYNDGTLYINTSSAAKNTRFTLIHELIHYLSDNNGNVGFSHTVNYQGFEQFLGYGLTEGMTDLVAFMYCEANGISTPKDYGYINNDHIAHAYYMLEPKVVEWMFNSNHESMSEFVKNNIKQVASIPSGYEKEFAFHFYIYQDLLMDCSVGNIYNEYLFAKSFKSSFEILCVTTRAFEDDVLKQEIYDQIISNHDNNDVLKEMVFG